MTRSIDELRAVLQEEATLVRPDVTRRRAVVGRVRRRRTARAAMSSVVAVSVVVASYAGIAATVDRPDRPDETRIAGHGSDAFEWKPGAYPVLASGTFEGKRWTLEVIEDPDAAHPEDTESDAPEIAFRFEGGDASTFETFDSTQVLPEPFLTRLDDDTGLLTGAVSPFAASVTAELGDGRYFDAAIVDVAEGPLSGTSYYLVFLPSDAAGQVVARDSSETPIDRVSLEPAPEHEGVDLALGCRPSARADGPPREFRFDPEPGTYPVLAQGRYEGDDWTLEMIDDPAAVHPEDTESEHPEVHFAIEGGEIEGGAFETYRDWQVVEAGLQFRLDDGTEVVIGMVAAGVESVTVELDGGRSFPAEIAAGDEAPLPGTDYYLAFLPSDAEGEVVARDSSGAVMGTARLPGTGDGPPCPSDGPKP